VDAATFERLLIEALEQKWPGVGERYKGYTVQYEDVDNAYTLAEYFGLVPHGLCASDRADCDKDIRHLVAETIKYDVCGGEDCDLARTVLELEPDDPALPEIYGRLIATLQAADPSLYEVYLLLDPHDPAEDVIVVAARDDARLRDMLNFYEWVKKKSIVNGEYAKCLGWPDECITQWRRSRGLAEATQ